MDTLRSTGVSQVEIVRVDATNLGERGFFCYKSKLKTDGYHSKSSWLGSAIEEGLQLAIVYQNGKSVGFIEYAPGPAAWRAVDGIQNWFVIHCLWVVGSNKKKGYGSKLLETCLQDAQGLGADGVAMVTTKNSHWVAGGKLLHQHGFQWVDQAPPLFELWAKRFRSAGWPSSPQNWSQRRQRFGSGLVVVYAPQCPYLASAIRAVQEAGEEIGIDTKVIQLKSAQEVQQLAPSPYGIYAVLWNGELVTYHSLPKTELIQLLRKRRLEDSLETEGFH